MNVMAFLGVQPLTYLTLIDVKQCVVGCAKRVFTNAYTTLLWQLVQRFIFVKHKSE